MRVRGLSSWCKQPRCFESLRNSGEQGIVTVRASCFVSIAGICSMVRDKRLRRFSLHSTLFIMFFIRITFGGRFLVFMFYYRIV